MQKILRQAGHLQRNSLGQIIRSNNCCPCDEVLQFACANCIPTDIRFPLTLFASIGPADPGDCTLGENCSAISGAYALDFWGYEGADEKFVDYQGVPCSGTSFGGGCVWGLRLSGLGDSGVRLCDGYPTFPGQVLDFLGLSFRIRNLNTTPVASWEASLSLWLNRWIPPPDLLNETCPDNKIDYIKVVNSCADIFPFSFDSPTFTPPFFYTQCDWSVMTALVT